MGTTEEETRKLHMVLKKLLSEAEAEEKLIQYKEKQKKAQALRIEIRRLDQQALQSMHTKNSRRQRRAQLVSAQQYESRQLQRKQALETKMQRFERARNQGIRIEAHLLSSRTQMNKPTHLIPLPLGNVSRKNSCGSSLSGSSHRSSSRSHRNSAKRKIKNLISKKMVQLTQYLRKIHKINRQR